MSAERDFVAALESRVTREYADRERYYREYDAATREIAKHGRLTMITAAGKHVVVQVPLPWNWRCTVCHRVVAAGLDRCFAHFPFGARAYGLQAALVDAALRRAHALDFGRRAEGGDAAITRTGDRAMAG